MKSTKFDADIFYKNCHEIKMSLIDQDIINNYNSIIFILIANQQDKIVGVYDNLSSGLKALYLADEASTLQVNYLNHQSMAHINDTYDCLIGFFSFEGDCLIYNRNLTNELEEINDETLLLTTEDLMQIKLELDQIENEQKNKNANVYHEKAHEMVDKSIIEKFNQLSKLLMTKLIKFIREINSSYDMNFEYDLIFECNQFYQEANIKLNGATLKEKIEIINKINILKSKVSDEIVTLINLITEFAVEKGELFDGSSSLSSDNEMQSLMMETDLFNNYDIRSRNDRNLKNNHLSIQKNNQFGKILYGSPPPSPPKQIEEKKIPLKNKDPSVRKKVVFSDEVTVHIY